MNNTTTAQHLLDTLTNPNFNWTYTVKAEDPEDSFTVENVTFTISESRGGILIASGPDNFTEVVGYTSIYEHCKLTVEETEENTEFVIDCHEGCMEVISNPQFIQI